MAKKSIFTRLLFSTLAIVLSQNLLIYWLWQEQLLNANAIIALMCAILLGLPLLFKWRLAPIKHALGALDNGVSALKDQDFSLTIHNQKYIEVSDLIKVYNELTSVLRHERLDIFQRELLLDTVIQSTPVSLVLTNSNGSIVYSNLAARKLLKQKHNINGENFLKLTSNLSPMLQQATQDKTNGLITEIVETQSTVYNINCREFTLNGREHFLFLYKNMTAEMSQKEIDLWKQVIRLISHELNNSLAPIASLTRSAKKIIETPEHIHLLNDVLETIGNRAHHLNEFIGQYAKFARLPKPNKQSVVLQKFVQQLETLTKVTVKSELYSEKGTFDAGQIEQVIINLVKNAKESGSAIEDVGLQIKQQANLLEFAIFDRGSGLSDAQMQQALLPFFTTKKTGSGIGLALCNDVVSNHGGKLKLANREHGGLCVSFALDLREHKTD